MAEKKYFWLKLTEGFFTDKPIKKLRKIAGGDTYTIIYLKMLLKAISQEEKLYYEGVEETFAAELALELDEDVENVAVTLSYLQKRGLLVAMSEEEYQLTQCGEMVGTETDAARRKRKQREREAMKQLQPVVETMLLEEEKKPQKETQIQLFQRLAVNYQLSDTLKEKIETWFRYKTEKKETYKEQGMKSLLKQIEKRALQYGDKPIMDLIESCMSNNYKGIIWDILEKNRPAGRIENRVSEVDNW